MKKYEFTGETKTVCVASREVTLHRIRALVSFGTIKAGDVGGWIESESNLSHKDDSWVCEDAQVYDNARVCGNAQVYGDAKVCGNANIYGNAKVYGNAQVYGDADVCGNAEIYDSAKVCGKVWIFNDAKIYGKAWIFDSAKVYEDARVYGKAIICSNAEVCGNAEIFLPNHVLVIGAIGSRKDFTTFYHGWDKQIIVKCGCFNGTLNEFLDKVTETHGNNHHATVYRAAAEVARLQIDLESEAPEREEDQKIV